MSYVEQLAFEHAVAASDRLNAAVAGALNIDAIGDAALFGFGTGLGIALGWWVGDLLRRLLRWYAQWRA